MWTAGQTITPSRTLGWAGLFAVRREGHQHPAELAGTCTAIWYGPLPSCRRSIGEGPTPAFNHSRLRSAGCRSRPVVPRSAEALAETAASRELVARIDPRQPDLFTPIFIEPCKPLLSERVPTGDRWQYEIKHHGYRVQVHVTGDEVRIFTKSGLDWADRRSAVLDGEP